MKAEGCEPGRSSCSTYSYMRFYSPHHITPTVFKTKAGFNIAVLHAISGKVLKASLFNTAVERRKSEEMAAFLNKLPPGRIVCGVTDKDYTAHLTENAKKALVRIFYLFYLSP